MGQGDHSSWTRDSRFKPLLEALQELIDRQAREKARFPGDHPEYNQGFIDGLIQAKGMAGYYSQYSLQEEAEILAMMESPEAKAELAQAEARLARGEVRTAEEVRTEQGSRIRLRLEPSGQVVPEKNASHISERLELETSSEREIDG
jgi:hypothetical protein